MKSSRANPSLTTEFSLVKENILLQAERITQLYVIQSEQDALVWFGVLFVDSGLYMGSVIRFNMYIDDSYPECPCPKIIFKPIPFHPLVDPKTGELDTKNAFPDWRSTTHRLHQLLLFVKRVICQANVYIEQIQELFNQKLNTGGISSELENIDLGLHGRSQLENMNQFSDSSENIRNLFTNFESTMEFISIYENNPDEFRRRVEEFKNICCHRLFDKPSECGDDKNTLIFTPWDADTHEPIRSCVLAGKFTPTTLFASYHKETESVSFVPGSEPSCLD